jgi:hypothetical protein
VLVEEPSTALKADIAEVVIAATATTANLSREGFDEAGPIQKPGRVSRGQLYQAFFRARSRAFFAPDRVILLIFAGGFPDFSAMSRSCSIRKPCAR